MKTLQEAMDALPNTSPKIAKLMRERGIKGYKSNAFTCPIAKYIAKETGCSDVSVSYERAHMYHLGFETAAEFAELSDAAKRFIRSFDQGRYPDLKS